MAVIVNRENDKNSDLSRRIDTDLREKMAAAKSGEKGNSDPDFAEDTDYAKDLKKTSRFGWIWIVLVIVAVVVVIAASVI